MERRRVHGTVVGCSHGAMMAQRPAYAHTVDRLRMILLMRGLLALFFVVLGVVVLTSGDVVFGIFAVAIGAVNAALIVVLARRARRAG